MREIGVDLGVSRASVRSGIRFAIVAMQKRLLACAGNTIVSGSSRQPSQSEYSFTHQLVFQ